MRQWLANLNENLKKVVLLLWTTFLFAVHFLPGQNLPHSGWMDTFQVDKGIHFMLFYCSSYIYLELLIRSGRNDLFLLFLFSPFFLEFAQHLATTDRDFDFMDILADYLGIFLFFRKH